MGSSGGTFLVQSSEVGAEGSQFQFCVFVCWSVLVVGFEVHLWVVLAKDLGRRVLPKVCLSDVAAVSIDGCIDVV